MKIIELSRQEYQNYEFQSDYICDHYYDVHVLDFGFQLELKQTEQPIRRTFCDHLFADWMEDVHAFGIFDGKELAGFVEGSIEEWHQLFRISNLFVYPSYRGKGIGQQLLQYMEDYVHTHTTVRGIILETQSCNYPAIQLYLKRGFVLCRIDTHEFTNEDIQRQEIRLDLIKTR